MMCSTNHPCLSTLEQNAGRLGERYDSVAQSPVKESTMSTVAAQQVHLWTRQE